MKSFYYAAKCGVSGETAGNVVPYYLHHRRRHGVKRRNKNIFNVLLKNRMAAKWSPGQLLQNGLQITGNGAVLQHKAGDADTAVLPNVGIDGAVLPQGQIGLQVGQTGGQVLEIDFCLGLAEAIEGIKGVGAQNRWLPMTVTFMEKTPFAKIE